MRRDRAEQVERVAGVRPLLERPRSATHDGYRAEHLRQTQDPQLERVPEMDECRHSRSGFLKQEFWHSRASHRKEKESRHNPIDDLLLPRCTHVSPTIRNAKAIVRSTTRQR